MVNGKIEALKVRLSGGVAPAMATPLDGDGYAVNTAVLPALIDFLMSAGVKGLFVGGTTGEGILLAARERMRLHEAVVRYVNGRFPVIVHTGHNRLETAVSLTRHAEEIGADAIAAVTPYFYGVSEDALAAYYHALAAAAPNTPLLLYDIPQLAVNGITPTLLRRLSQELPTLAGLKTSRPDVQVVRQLIDAAAEHQIVLAGNESAALGLLALGADGLISGLSTAVPEPFVALTHAVSQGNLADGQQCQRVINKLLACLPAGERIGAIKRILTERGIPAGTAVPPRPMPHHPIWPTMQPLLTALPKVEKTT
ncbi:MAG: dihydrodipicolinate synthase family protein [Chloroflexi bacterium]|nr:MAG: dihydrodipicolinate synthase family protein [Chloroflexota bacterium]